MDKISHLNDSCFISTEFSMDKKKPSRQYNCCAHSILQTSRSRLCSLLRLPMVNAATLYKRVPPPSEHGESEEHSVEEEVEEKTLHKKDLKTEDKKLRLSTITKFSKEDLQPFVDEEMRMTGLERIKRAYTFE